MVGMGDLLPPRLPPLNSVTGSFDMASSTLTGSIYSPSRMREDGMDENGNPRMLTQRSLQTNSMLSSSLADHHHRLGGQDAYDHEHAMMQQSLTDPSQLSGSQERSIGSDHHHHHHHHSGDGAGGGGHGGHGGRGGHYLERIDSEGAMHLPPRESPSVKSKSATSKAKSPTHIPFAHMAEEKAQKHKHQQLGGDTNPQSGQVTRQSSMMGLDDQTVDTTPQDTERRSSLAQYTEDLTLLFSRPFALPLESKNCLVQVYTSKTYDENVYLKVVTSGISPQVLCERSLQIDKAYEVVNAAGNSSSLMHGTDNEDLATLSALLINMFKEADDDGSGKFSPLLLLQSPLDFLFCLDTNIYHRFADL